MASKDTDPTLKALSELRAAANPKSRKAAKAIDGRATNETPVANRIKKGEVRNPYGRRGKPQAAPLNDVDAIYLAEAQKIVSKDADGAVTALKRMIQQDFHSALVMGNERASSRILATLRDIKERRALSDEHALAWIWEMKSHYTEEFETARRTRQPPPDVIHPDHVLIRGDVVSIVGPNDVKSRKLWEERKEIIRIAEYFHSRARRIHQEIPTADNLSHLKQMEAHRRRVMRTVPKGWNWREDIYCRYSRTEATAKLIAELQALDEKV